MVMDTSAMTVGNPVEGDPRLLDRELSWLDFNARVLALAQHDETPILERLKFLAIFSANLDEYFQTRVAALKERADTPGPLADQINAQLVEIHTRTTELVGRQSDSIAAYRIAEDGRVTLVGIEPSLGKGPQNLAITPGGELLLCANMPGNNVVVFRIDAQSGALKQPQQPVSVPSPSCIIIR